MKAYKRVISIILALILTFSVSSVAIGAFSLDDILKQSENSSTILGNLLNSATSLTTSKPVTLKINSGGLLSGVVKFDSTQNGYYYFYANSKKVSFNIIELKNNNYSPDFGSSSYSTKKGTAILAKLKKGCQYLLIVTAYGIENAPKDEFEVKLKASYYGKMTSLKITKQPTTTYVDGYNAYIKENVTLLDPTGLTGVAEFKNGKKLTVYGDFFFENSDLYTKNDPPAKVGKNVVSFKCCGFKLKLTYYVKKNPVKKIEVVSLPEKTEYVYGLGGEMSSLKMYNIGSVDLTGLKLKVTYTNGKTKTIGNFKPSSTELYVSSFEYTSKDSEYPLYVYAQDGEVPGSTVVDLDYMEKRTSFKVNVRKPTVQEITQNLPSYITLINDMIFYLFSSVSDFLPF